jgi:hypothetical protein
MADIVPSGIIRLRRRNVTIIERKEKTRVAVRVRAFVVFFLDWMADHSHVRHVL